MCSFVLLSSLIAIVASEPSQGIKIINDRQMDTKDKAPKTFMEYIPGIESMIFGTDEDWQTYRCNIKGCLWNETTVHIDWMFYGAGDGNPEAKDANECAKRCALD